MSTSIQNTTTTACEATEDMDTPEMLARQLLWSRIDAFEGLDRQLNEMEDLTAKLAELSQSDMNQAQRDLLHASTMATTTKVP